jgi:hypothetical protein
LEETIVTQEDERIKAMKFDSVIEARDIDVIVEAFAEDCEIELLGIMLSGKEGAHK